MLISSSKFSAKAPVVFIADIDQIKEFNGNLRSKIVVGGTLMAASLSNPVAPNGFVKQEVTARPPFSLKSLFKSSASDNKKSSSISLFFSRESLTELGLRKIKGISAFDCILKYGYSHKSQDVFSVIMAFEAKYVTSIAVLTFKNNSLIMYSDAIISSPEHEMFEADLKILMERYSDPSFGELHWAGSIMAPSSYKLIKVPHSVWSSVPATLSVNQSASFFATYGAAAGIIFASVIGSAGLISVPYFEYAKYKEMYLNEDSATKAVYKGDSNMIDVIKRRQGLIIASSSKVDVVSKFEAVLKAVSVIPNVKIGDIHLEIPIVEAPSNSRGSTEPLEYAFSFDAHVKPNGLSEIDQSKEFITLLNSSTGYFFRVIETSTTDNDRLFKIQGDFK